LICLTTAFSITNLFVNNIFLPKLTDQNDDGVPFNPAM
jgi:hypothetical protein